MRLIFENMKKSFVSLAAMLLLLAGCQKPELVDTVGDNSAFEASVEAFDCQTSGEGRGLETEFNPVAKDSINHAC